VDFLLRLASRVQGRRLVHVNSTREGGGVAEILNRLVPIMRDLGIKTDWEVIEGDSDFYATTKAFHNALQGEEQVLTEAMLEHYLEVNRANAERLRLAGDLVLIHDPQPAAMIEARAPEGKWVWRCHIDLSTPQRRVWTFLRRFVVRYDAAVFSLPAFAQQLPIPQFLAYPSIDPLADKNRRMSAKEVKKILERLGVPDDKPILLQVSRFDRFKDPIGVVNAYRLVKRYHDVRLVLAGGRARARHLPAGPAVQRPPRDQRAPARRDHRDPEVHARGVRPHRGRGHVEGQAGHRRGGRRHHRADRVRRHRLHRELRRGVRVPDPLPSEQPPAHAPHGLGRARACKGEFPHHPAPPRLPVAPGSPEPLAVDIEYGDSCPGEPRATPPSATRAQAEA
jgi:hypothetical protein